MRREITQAPAEGVGKVPHQKSGRHNNPAPQGFLLSCVCLIICLLRGREKADADLSPGVDEKLFTEPGPPPLPQGGNALQLTTDGKIT